MLLFCNGGRKTRQVHAALCYLLTECKLFRSRRGQHSNRHEHIRTKSTAILRASDARMCLVDSGTGQQLKRSHEIASCESDRSVCLLVRLFYRSSLSSLLFLFSHSTFIFSSSPSHLFHVRYPLLAYVNLYSSVVLSVCISFHINV